jgi:hypothetical protein
MAMTMTPRIRPAIIDSHGKPGIAGSTIGVVTVLVAELTVVEGVLSTVTVDTETLAIVDSSELVVSTAWVVVLDDVTLELDEDTIVADAELDAEVSVVSDEFDVVPPPLNVGGVIGSRWKIPVRGFMEPVVLGCAPTAHPSVELVVNTENNPNPLATGVGMFILVHPAPFHHAVTSFPEHVRGVVAVAAVRSTLQPTAHPSALPAVVPYVST